MREPKFEHTCTAVAGTHSACVDNRAAVMDGRTVGVLGGGQLGRMMAEAGHRLGVKVAVLDPLGTASPAGQVAELAVEGSFRDADKIK